MAGKDSVALLPGQLSAMDNHFWDQKPKYKMLWKRAHLTSVVFEWGQEQGVFWMPFTAKHLSKTS